MSNLERVAIVIVFAFFIALGTMIYSGINSLKENHAFRQTWMKQHDCKPEGYVGNGYRVYRCDDGIQYTISDMPTK